MINLDKVVQEVRVDAMDQDKTDPQAAVDLGVPDPEEAAAQVTYYTDQSLVPEDALERTYLKEPDLALEVVWVESHDFFKVSSCISAHNNFFCACLKLFIARRR